MGAESSTRAATTPAGSRRAGRGPQCPDTVRSTGSWHGRSASNSRSRRRGADG